MNIGNSYPFVIATNRIPYTDFKYEKYKGTGEILS